MGCVCVSRASSLGGGAGLVDGPAHPEGDGRFARTGRQRSSGWRRHPSAVFKNTESARRGSPRLPPEGGRRGGYKRGRGRGQEADAKAASAAEAASGGDGGREQGR